MTDDYSGQPSTLGRCARCQNTFASQLKRAVISGRKREISEPSRPRIAGFRGDAKRRGAMQASLFSRSTVIVIIAYVTHVTRFADNERNIPVDFRLAQREIERPRQRENDRMSESEWEWKSKGWARVGESAANKTLLKESPWSGQEANIGYRQERILSIMGG